MGHFGKGKNCSLALERNHGFCLMQLAHITRTVTHTGHYSVYRRSCRMLQFRCDTLRTETNVTRLRIPIECTHLTRAQPAAVVFSFGTCPFLYASQALSPSVCWSVPPCYSAYIHRLVGIPYGICISELFSVTVSLELWFLLPVGGGKKGFSFLHLFHHRSRRHRF